MFGGTQEKLEGGRMGLGMIKIHYIHIQKFNRRYCKQRMVSKLVSLL